MDAPADIVGTWLSLLPAVVAIGLAITTRQVFISLFVGVWMGTTLIAEGNPLAGLADALEACVSVFGDAGNTRVIIFSAMIGALITITQSSGGVAGFVAMIERRRLAHTERRALVLSWCLGVVVFIESSITSLVNGSVCRPLFDRLKISREKLAYLCDATAAPICILIPLNAWGAYIIRILEREEVPEPVDALVGAIPFNFYALLTLVFSFVVVAWLRRDFGPMRRAERRVKETGALHREGAEPVVSDQVTGAAPAPGTPARAVNFLIPLLVMVAMMPIGLVVTGDGDPLAGSGSTSVLWAVLAGVGVAAALALSQRILTLPQTTRLFFTGFGGLMPLAALMVMAFAIGDISRALQTGAFVASVAQDVLIPELVPAVLFGLACFIAFATGTSWGTFAIMLPIGLSVGTGLGVSPELTIAAVLGGGVFGDHCSPISDTTLIASLAAGTDHIDHVNTQLPYAMTVAGVSLVGYLIAGFVTG